MSGPLRALLDTATPPRPNRVVGAATIVLALPLVVALVALSSPRWYPLLDMSQIELRLRDVWSSHPPLVGLAGRIVDEGRQGSHPGPLGFYAIWPVYKLLGSTSWAMEASSVAVQTVAVGVSLWIANRRGGLALLLALAATLAILLRAFGAEILTQPWNPYLPVLWWVVFVLAVWSVCCDDLVLLPVAVVAGSLCAQSEVAFLGLTVVLGLAAVGVAGWRAYRRRGNPEQRKRSLIAAAITFGAALLVWLPPIVEELTSTRGNLSVLFDYFLSGSTTETTAGFGQAIHELAVLLNPITLVSSSVLDGTRSDVIPGYVFFGVWAASAAMAWRLRTQALIWLHAVLGLAIATGLFSISRIFGTVWYYLVLWGWGLNALMLFAIGWTLALVVRRRVEPTAWGRTARIGARALAGLTLVVTAVFAFQAASVTSPTPRLGAQLGQVVGPTVRALEREWGRDRSRDETFLVTFFDPRALGSQGFGLVSELERVGFDVGLGKEFRTAVVAHRVVDPADATAVVHLAVGKDIATWRANPDAREVAYSDPRTPVERKRQARLREELIAELQAADLYDLVPAVDENLFGLGLDPRLPEEARKRVDELGRIGLPIAVFVASPESA